MAAKVEAGAIPPEFNAVKVGLAWLLAGAKATKGAASLACAGFRGFKFANCTPLEWLNTVSGDRDACGTGARATKGAKDAGVAETLRVVSVKLAVRGTGAKAAKGDAA